MPPEQGLAFSTNPVARQEWVNRRTIIDEILNTPDGPAVVLRKTSVGKTTTWDLVFLAAKSPVVPPLPFTSPSRWAHVTADTRNGRVVFLVSDRLWKAQGGAPPRLIVARWNAP
jgi:hypothetical protein